MKTGPKLGGHPPATLHEAEKAGRAQAIHFFTETVIGRKLDPKVCRAELQSWFAHDGSVRMTLPLERVACAAADKEWDRLVQVHRKTLRKLALAKWLPHVGTFLASVTCAEILRHLLR